MKHLTMVLFAAVLLWSVPIDGQAQLLEVKQTVYGMDCAPCAYALEKRVGRLDGVKEVSVSLNEGLLTVTLKQENQLSLQGIRKATEESGFEAKEATITIAGEITKNQAGNYVLETASGEQFELQHENPDDLKEMIQASQQFVISGQVGSEDDKKSKLTVKQIKKAEG